MKVSIRCDEAKGGWIYSKFLHHLQQHSKHKLLINGKGDVTHYLPYYLATKPTSPFTVWSSHQEPKNPLKDLFVSSALQADWALCHAAKYVSLLQSAGVTKVSQCIPGVDLDLFRLRSSPRPKSNKLIVGWVGRAYQSSTRKNPTLLDKLATLTFLDLRITGGTVKEADLPRFYAYCDLIVSPSVIEGGPMCVTEALAVGVPVLAYAGVGVADEFQVLKVPHSDERAFVMRLVEFWRNKEFEVYRKPEIAQQLRAQVDKYEWSNWVAQHDSIWEAICG
jgi:glycosyltransferase involved in cell wall biosynthesis